MPPLPPQAGGPVRLRVAVFEGAWNLPLWVAAQEGFFDRQGLQVEAWAVPSSGALMKALHQGEVELALAGADNFIAYEEGMGELQDMRTQPTRIVMGGDGGFLALMGSPATPDIGALRGRSVGVDAFSTGFAYVARALLQRHGIAESEVQWVPRGGTAHRYRALLAGGCDATLLRLPFDLLATAQGCHALLSAAELGAYQGTVGGVCTAWAETHRAQLVGFLRAYRQGLEWARSPTHREAAASLITRQLPEITAPLAQRVLDQLLGTGGLQGDMRVDRAGLRTVLSLRERFARMNRPLGSVERYLDESYLLLAESAAAAAAAAARAD